LDKEIRRQKAGFVWRKTSSENDRNLTDLKPKIAKKLFLSTIFFEMAIKKGSENTPYLNLS